MRIITIDDREHAICLHQEVKRWNSELGLNATIRIQRLPVGDLLYETDEKEGIILFSIIEERKAMNDLLQSIYNRRLNNQFAGMSETDHHRKLWGIEGNSTYLNAGNRKAISTLKAEACALGIFIVEEPDTSMLAHNFISQCLFAGGHRVMKVSVMINPITNEDRPFVARLKQYPGLGDEGAAKLAAEYSCEGELFSAPCHPDVFVEDVLPNLPFIISEVLRKGKVLKKKPKYPLLVSVQMVESFYGPKYPELIAKLKQEKWGVKNGESTDTEGTTENQ